MTNFQKPIERFENDKNKDWSLPPVQRLEKDKKAKDDGSFSSKKEIAFRSLVFAALAICSKNFLDLLLSKKNSAQAVDLKLVEEHLLSFKKLLQKLCHEDLSRTAPFTRALSDLWIQLHLDLQAVEAFEGNRPSTGPKLKAILNSIGSFPPTSDHPLGYYLTEHVGQEWLPFPFMDILSFLYKQHLRSGPGSVLSQWISLTSTLID